MDYQSRVRHAIGARDLHWLISVIWPHRPGVAMSASRYRLSPSATRPWIVLPVMGRWASARALLSLRRLQSRRQLALRLLSAVDVTRRPVLGGDEICLSDGLAPHLGLIAQVNQHVAVDVRPMVVLGEAHPLRKPTMQMVDRRGRTHAFVKIGWNEPTARLVRRDAQVLATVASRLGPDAPLRTPGVLMSGWLADIGLEALVTAPMPRTARLWSPARTPPDPLIRAVAQATGSEPGTSPSRVRDLVLWSDLESLTARVADAEGSAAGGVLLGLVQLMVDRLPDDARCQVGGWHGDFSPWNLAEAEGTVWVWDWEHAGPHRPVGFDLMHFCFAVDRHVHRRSMRVSVDALRQQARARLPGLGVDRAAVDVLVVAYLVERWLRDIVATGAPGDSAPTVDPVVLADVVRAWAE